MDKVPKQATQLVRLSTTIDIKVCRLYSLLWTTIESMIDRQRIGLLGTYNTSFEPTRI